MYGSYLKAKKRNISRDNIKRSLVYVNMYEPISCLLLLRRPIIEHAPYSTSLKALNKYRQLGHTVPMGFKQSNQPPNLLQNATLLKLSLCPTVSLGLPHLNWPKARGKWCDKVRVTPDRIKARKDLQRLTTHSLSHLLPPPLPPSFPTLGSTQAETLSVT